MAIDRLYTNENHLKCEKQWRNPHKRKSFFYLFRSKTHNLQNIKFIKLGRKDSNLRISVPKTAALPLGDVPKFTQEFTLKKEIVCCFQKVLTWSIFSKKAKSGLIHKIPFWKKKINFFSKKENKIFKICLLNFLKLFTSKKNHFLKKELFHKLFCFLKIERKKRLQKTFFEVCTEIFSPSFSIF